jgi:DNA-binding MarR family transcriptional regulator
MTTFNTPKSDQAAFYDGSHYVMEESIGYLIRQAQLAMHRTIDTRMVALDLTAQQWIPLLLLDQRKAQTAAELSRCLGVDTSTTTRMLDRLEAKGLLERQRSAEDRRIINLVLTETGKTLAGKIPYVTAESLNLHLRDFSQAEFTELKRLLRKLTANEEGPACE